MNFDLEAVFYCPYHDSYLCIKIISVLLNSLVRYWLIRLCKFQVYISLIHDLYIALCAHHPKSSHLLSPDIWPPLPLTTHPLSFVNFLLWELSYFLQTPKPSPPLSAPRALGTNGCYQLFVIVRVVCNYLFNVCLVCWTSWAQT